METHTIVVAYDQYGMALFAASTSRFEKTLISYCELFGLDKKDCFNDEFIVKESFESRLWVIFDESGSDRKLVCGDPQEVLDVMKKYIQHFGNPKGAFVSLNYIKCQYSYDGEDGMRAIFARPLPYRK
jgi:intein-encoded DNA endonuclease-like protein